MTRRAKQKIIEDLRHHNLELLSPYTRIKDKHRLKCTVCGEEMTKTLHHAGVETRITCPECLRNHFTKINLEKAKKMEMKVDQVLAKKGKRRIGKYNSAKTPLKMKCLEHNLEYTKTYDSIKNSKGGGCPKCKSNAYAQTKILDPKMMEEFIHALCAFKMGKWLQKGPFQYMWDIGKFKCDGCDTIFEQTFAHIDQGYWCPACAQIASGIASRKYDINDLKEFARRKGGDCLSEEYTVTTDYYSWQCSLKHKWDTTFHLVKRGAWCPHCANQRYQYTLTDIYNFVGNKGGTVLKIDDEATSMRVECKKTHRFNISSYDLFHGEWCPECTELATEYGGDF